MTARDFLRAALAVAEESPELGDFPDRGVQPISSHRSNWKKAKWPCVTRRVWTPKGGGNLALVTVYPESWAVAYAAALGLPLSKIVRCSFGKS